MNSQTALVTRNCRLNEWTRMVHECKSRSAGMFVDEWCKINSTAKANYYYRTQQVRTVGLDALPSEMLENTVIQVSLKLAEKESTSISTVFLNNNLYA